MSDPTILTFDTSAAHCAAALLVGDRIVASAAEDMVKGQAERLMPMLLEVLAEASLDWPDIDAIGVGVGPGNFTGIRIAVSAARGLALARGVPAYGIPGMEAADDGQPGLRSLPATRGQLYVQGIDLPLQMLPEAAAQSLAVTRGLALLPPPNPSEMVEAIARHAARRFPTAEPAPKPLYLRPADAAPARDLPPVLLD